MDLGLCTCVLPVHGLHRKHKDEKQKRERERERVLCDCLPLFAMLLLLVGIALSLRESVVKGLTFSQERFCFGAPHPSKVGQLMSRGGGSVWITVRGFFWLQEGTMSPLYQSLKGAPVSVVGSGGGGGGGGKSLMLVM